METKHALWNRTVNLLRRTTSPTLCAESKGQAMVEFTLVFLLLLIVAWVPADFGLAFYTGQIAQNAAREGARIAAADPTLTAPVSPSCGPPLSSCFGAGNIFNETAVRMPMALMGSTSKITVTYPAAGSTACNQLVEVKVEGKYPFFFYKVLNMIGFNPNVPDIIRTAKMRWEHKC